MSATVAAIFKKIAAYCLTNKKVLKVIGGVVLGIVIIIMMPVIVVLSVFSGGFDFQTASLQENIVGNISPEEESKFGNVESLTNSIETEMTAAGYSAARVKEAQVIYTLALSQQSKENLVSKLVDCFAADQTDEQLVDKVNSTFGTKLVANEFKNVMDGIRAVYIDVSGYTDPTTKNNLDLAEWAKQAKKSGWGYVYGTYGEVLDENLLASKISQYPNEVGKDEEFIRKNWLGRRTSDSIGLIKSYGWYNKKSQSIEIGANSMPDIDANTMYENAAEKGTIDTIPEIPGLAVWYEGHIGIYIGGGQVIHAANTTAGVIQTPIGNSGWTHWLKVPYITYIEETEESE